MKYTATTWDEIYDMLIEITKMIEKPGFKPDLIIGVSRGGLTPARVLSDMLNNPRIAIIKVEFYVGLGETGKRPIVTQPLGVPVEGKVALIVDDVADTGESIKVAISHIAEKGAREIKTATLYYKPHSSFKPDFYIKETSAWIIFPWERLEATRQLIEDAFRAGRSIQSVKDILVDSGIEEKLAERLIALVRGE